MPLLSGLGQVVGDAGEGHVAIPEPVGTIAATWIDPTGTEWPLTSHDIALGMFTRQPVSGWGATAYEIVTDPLSRGGESVRFVRQQPARVQWPLHVYGHTHLEFLERYRAVKRAITMTVHRRTPGILRVTRPDGSGREIDAWYEDGLEGDGPHDWVSANPVVTLYCPDGYWRDVQPYVVTRKYANPTSYLNPFPTVSSAQVLGDTVIYNPGDVLAWPDWTIQGPFSAVTATNTTTGDAFTLTHTALVGQTVRITTNRPTVRDGAGTNLVGSLSWPSAVLWGLLPGDNQVTFAVTGAAAGTQIDLTFHPRYEGA